MSRLSATARSLLLRLSFLCPMAFTVPSALSQSVSDVPDGAAAEPAYELAAVFERLANDIPAHLHDVDGLAEYLDYNVQGAADFVANEIYYEPYAGVMRGPAGTLSSRAGSAWDQAVLLAALINAMGGEALLVQGALPEAEMDRLLEQAFAPNAATESAVTIAQMRQILGELFPQSALDSVDQVFAVDAQTRREIDTLGDSVAQGIQQALAGVDRNASPDPLSAFRAQVMANYVWVRFRDTPQDPWVDIHPAFGGAPAPATSAELYLADSVPEEQLHRLEISLEIERTAGGRRETLAIMDPYERPVANLAALQLAITVTPSEYRPDGGLPSYWVPGINGSSPQGAQAFTPQGLIVNAADAMSGPGVFGELARKLAGGIDAIDEGAAPRLTGVLLKMTHIAPGGSREVRTRRLVDFRDGEPVTAAGQVTLEGTLSVVTGPENMARRYHTLFTRLAEIFRAAPQLREAMQLALRGEDPGDELRGVELSPIWVQMLTQTPLMTAAGDSSLAWLYRSPLVAMRRVSRDLRERTLPRQTVDILFQEQVALRRQDDRVIVDQDPTLRLGVRRSVTETLWTGGDSNRAALTDARLIAVTSDAELADVLAGRELSTASREAMASDLQSGGVLLASAGHPVWWHVDPVTGVSLLRSEIGGASPTTSEIILQLGLTFYSVGSLTYGVVDCGMTYGGGKGKKANPAMLTCCAQANVVMFTGGGIIGNALGSAIGLFGDVVAEGFMDRVGAVDPLGRLCSAAFE